MIKFIDSHCHLDRLDLTHYDENLELALLAAKEHGVSHILSVAVDLDAISSILTLAETYPFIYASVGMHPTEKPDQVVTMEELIAKANHPKVVAIGETGLDYYHQPVDIEFQQTRFRMHIRAAKALNKPIIVHTRMAREDTIRILQEEKADDIGGVMHCFTEDWEMAKQAIDLNFYISISGIVTFRSALELKDIAKQIPLDRLLIETDAPYLAPVPKRGKPNEPAYLHYIAEYIAELRGIPIALLAEKTTSNFFNFIKMPSQ
ncbi:MAG: putative metal-dependent hydrolase YcfH [Legionellaceae bacterium]